MPIGTDFLPFATSFGANVELQADFAGSPHQLSGFSSGIALPEQANKIWRQSSVMTAALANYISHVLNQLVPVDDGDLNKLISEFWQALLGGGYFVDTGSAGAISVAAPAGLTFGTPFAGLSVTVRVASICTGATTFSWAGTGVAPVTYPNGEALFAGAYDLHALLTLKFDGVNWQLVSGGATLQFTTASQTVYIRTDGNDSHDGSANSAAKAVATLPAAYRIASHLYTPGGSVVIKLGIPGSYVAATPPTMSTPITIVGDQADQNSYIIHGGASQNFGPSSSTLTIEGVALWNDDSSNLLITAAYGASINLAYVTLQAVGTINTAAAIKVYPGGSVLLGAGMIVGSNMGYLLFADGGSITLQVGASITALGGPAFSGSVVYCGAGGQILLAGALPGAATGKRYTAVANGVIDTQGGGASFIYGSTPGSTASGGQYL